MPTNLPMSRIPEHTYEDPLDRIWMTAAARIGLKVRRSADVYAATDGAGNLTIGAKHTLDSDDSLAQMIFHELCHSLVEGPESLDREDWGLSNYDDKDQSREYAALRLQAALAAPRGLRWFFAPTTEHRAFYDALDEDPLPPIPDPIVIAARRGAANAERRPWAPHLFDALEATSYIASIIDRFAESPDASLWSRVEEKTPTLDLGFPRGVGERRSQTCESCAWRHVDVRGRSICRQAMRRISPQSQACERWEPALDCQTCGACCREAYGVVEISPRDPFVKKHPSLVVLREDGRRELGRIGNRCAHLGGGATPTDPYACSVYEDRPRTCRDFTLGSDHCLTARRRVGLSR